MGYKCKICGKEYKSNTSGSCSKHMSKHDVEFIDLQTHYDEIEIIEEDKVPCPVCGKEYKNNLGGAITSHIIKEHNHTKEEVKLQFPQLFLHTVYDYGTEDRICAVCGNTYEHRIHKDKSTKKTCSKECANKLISIVKTKQIKSICKECGVEFSHKKSKQSVYCSIQCRAKSQEGRQEYKIKLDTDEIKRLYLDEGLSCEVIGRKYSTSKKMIRSRLKDMNVTLRDGHYSSVEDEIIEWLKSLDIKNIIKNDRKVLNGKELDIYLPDYNFAIEYNGLYWHSELQGKDKNYHLNKTVECEKQGIYLLHIFEDEWLEKTDIIKNIISTKLAASNKIYARKCIIKEIESKDTKQFLNDNHIQGYIAAKVNVGLYYEDELVSLLTFRKSRFNKGYDWEIARYVNKSGFSITGGFAKMLKHFRKEYKGSIITYSDRRLFDGSIYENNGFEKLKPSTSNYYYTKYTDRQTRQNFQKHKLEEKLDVFDPGMTEWENMQMNGWDRIWDCGNNVFIVK